MSADEARCKMLMMSDSHDKWPVSPAGQAAEAGLSRTDQPGSDQRRFVVLRHEQDGHHHFDLMIDTGAALATWKMSEPPETIRVSPLDCVRLPDHRRRYLDYEGPLTENRGEVTRHDAGYCIVHACSAACWEVTFCGGEFRGRVLLERTAQSDNWSLRVASA